MTLTGTTRKSKVWKLLQLFRREKHQPRNAPGEQGQWTYEDWLRLPDDGYRYEVIDRVLYLAPLPRILHQRVSLGLVCKLSGFVKRYSLGKVLFAPVGVRLPNQALALAERGARQTQLTLLAEPRDYPQAGESRLDDSPVGKVIKMKV